MISSSGMFSCAAGSCACLSYKLRDLGFNSYHVIPLLAVPMTVRNTRCSHNGVADASFSLADCNCAVRSTTRCSNSALRTRICSSARLRSAMFADVALN